MTEDIQPEVLKQTQESLGRFIKKPVLSEKLLRKPPFRFLHDICTSAMKETGFFEDTLSGNDIKIEMINDKEGKIAFLQKVIAAVEAANNVKLTVKPNKIVAGHEPIKTNEFLQALAFALEKQVETKAPKKTLRKAKTKSDPKEVKDDTVKRKNIANKALQKSKEADLEVSKKDSKKKKPSEKKPAKGKDEGVKKTEDKDVKLKIKPEATVLSNGVEKDEVIIPNGIEPNNATQNQEVKEKEPDISLEENNGEDINMKQPEPSNRPVSAKFKKRTPSARSAVKDSPSPDLTFAGQEVKNSTEAVDRVLGGVVDDDAKYVDPVPVTPSVTAGTTPALILAPAKTTAPVNNSDRVPQEPIAAPRPRTAIRPPSARPASARPAAPRIRDRGQTTLQEEVIRPAAGKVNLIVEQDPTQQDDEELVSVQTGQDNTDVALDPTPDTFPASIDDSQHGHLVAQILEAQKELEEDVFAKKRPTGRTEIEWSTGRGVEGTRREVERIQSAVQTLTRAANPLGKLLEYLQEDVDSMQQELASWKERNSNLSAKLEQEKSLTDKSIEPLKVHLNELEESIRHELEQIGALKATVLRNDDKVNHLLVGL